MTGVDLAPGLIETARRRAADAGLDVRFDVGDAEGLPYGDASFDIVSASMGLIFAPAASPDDDRRAQLEREFVAFLEDHRRDGEIRVPGRYVMVLGTRR